MENVSKVEIHREVSAVGVALQRVCSDGLQFILDSAKGKRVLNIGCCGSDVLVATETIHHKIQEVASYCVGIDIFEAGINMMRMKGENVYLANAEYFCLDDKNFDLIVMGDVIEHVSNPGLVFDNANRHLKHSGQIIVSTPNPFSLGLMKQNILRGKYFTNSEHVSWFDPVLLSYLAYRSGFKVEEILWIEGSVRRRFFLKRRPALHYLFVMVASKFRDVALPPSYKQIVTKG